MQLFGVPVSFLLPSIFLKKLVLNYGYIQGDPKGIKRFSKLE